MLYVTLHDARHLFDDLVGGIVEAVSNEPGRRRDPRVEAIPTNLDLLAGVAFRPHAGHAILVIAMY